MFFKKKKETSLSIYQSQNIAIDGVKLEDLKSTKGKFGDIVVQLDPGVHTISGTFIMTKGKENLPSDQMELEITLLPGKNILSVSDKLKHFRTDAPEPITRKFEHNDQQLQFYVGLLK